MGKSSIPTYSESSTIQRDPESTMPFSCRYNMHAEMTSSGQLALNHRREILEYPQTFVSVKNFTDVAVLQDSLPQAYRGLRKHLAYLV